MVRMLPKNDQKKIAISLRKEGKTYSEIRAQVPVAKSTLSLWLREIGLAKKQQQRITKKRIEAQQKGALARKTDRIAREGRIFQDEQEKVGKLSKRELMLIGAALYWAEGVKSKPYGHCPGLDFCNNDPRMIALYLTWLRCSLGVADSRIGLSVYIHENSRSRIEAVKTYWLNVTGLPKKHLTYVYYKKHTVRTVRKNIAPSTYFGLLRVRVSRSTDLNRVMQGWVLGIVKNCGNLV